MKNWHIPVLLFLLFSTLLNPVCGQRQTLIGLDGIVEWGDREFHPGIGVLMERRLTKHSGFEAGLFYKNYNVDRTVFVFTGTVLNTIRLQAVEHYLSIPLLYKFYTRIVNISAGPAFDYYVGFRQKNKSPSFTIDDYSRSPKLSLGALLKVSKSFSINKKLLLEPALRLNPNFSYERGVIGLGIAAKYKLDGG